MRNARLGLVTITILLLASTSVAAQQSSGVDSAGFQIRQTLRAFYFNLAHGDWEALTADILAAKVVAHRSPPAPGLIREREMPACVGRNGPQVDQAMIALTRDWAEVLVPHCGTALAAADEFRLIHFEQRWRFVAVHLYQEPLNLSTGR